MMTPYNVHIDGRMIGLLIKEKFSQRKFSCLCSLVELHFRWKSRRESERIKLNPDEEISLLKSSGEVSY